MVLKLHLVIKLSVILFLRSINGLSFSQCSKQNNSDTKCESSVSTVVSCVTYDCVSIKLSNESIALGSNEGNVSEESGQVNSDFKIYVISSCSALSKENLSAIDSPQFQLLLPNGTFTYLGSDDDDVLGSQFGIDEAKKLEDFSLDELNQINVKMCTEKDSDFEIFRRIVYITLDSIAACFAFLTMLSFLLVYEKQNIHGWTQCTHVFAFLLLLLSWLGSEVDIGAVEKTLTCKVLAIFNHFIYISTYAWLVVVNFDLMKAFWQAEIEIARHKDRIPKCGPIYLNYSAFGWGVPGTIVLVSMGLDFFVSVDLLPTEMRPNYGTGPEDESPCSVDFIGWPYVLLPNGLLFLFVILIIMNTLRVVSLNPGWFQTQSRRHHQGKILIWKILLAMGTFWFLDVMSLFYITIYHEQSMYLIAMDFFVLLQAIPIFVIYVCRPDSLNNLRDKFPKSRGFLERLGRAFCVEMEQAEPEVQMREMHQGGPTRLRVHRGSVAPY